MYMEIVKPNDILVATLNNPKATPYELLSNNINGDNTSLFTKEEYKQSDYIQKTFKDENGKFDEESFNNAYKLAEVNFFQLTNKQYLDSLDEINYSPFDITRPKFAKTINVTANFEKEYNPYEVKKGWTGIGSIDEGNLSLREIAQKGKIFDPVSKTWSEESLNDLSLFNKFFGDTLVYAQYDEDGQHIDINSGLAVEHKKGDWKVNDNGHLYLEKLAGREVYGKQVVNPMDVLTTDGSIINKFDFLDSDGRDKSIVGTAFKIGLEIAPFLIPEVGIFRGAMAIPVMYGNLKAIMGLSSVLPTFYKSFEGLLLGDNNSALTKDATQLEGWMAKFGTSSVSDASSASLFNVEQMGNLVSSIFSQIYEQRAAASLSKLIYKGDKVMNAEMEKMATKINSKLLEDALAGKIKFEDIGKLSQAAMEKIPTLKTVLEKQSQMSKALSLGYMALTSTGDIYGRAIEGGYDRRTAGFASLAAAAGQYGIMMNNRMGDWFLDKTTGYTTQTNKALMRKSILPWLDEVEKGFKATAKNVTEGKKQLSSTFSKIRNSINTTFTSPAILGEAMGKNAFIEGVEEVTEQMVLDATTGIVDIMSYLGLTKKQGSFGGWDTTFSKSGLENYLANFVGGLLGGGMFEFHRSKIAPWLNSNVLAPETQKSIYEIIASGGKNDVINIINSKRSSFGNNYVSPLNLDGSFQEAKEGTISQADLIADKAIEMVNTIDGILNSHDLIHTDEEIINKAIMDKIIIEQLNQAKPENSNIGLEGLVLEDYKNKMSKIVQLESSIKNLPDTEENKKSLKRLKEELEIYVKDVNDILEGKRGSKYFGEALLYLSKDIHLPFINLSKTDYAQTTYDLNYHELPESGLGLTKERIDKEWQDYINSKDIRQNLETAYNLYTNLEKYFNKPIVDYAKTGYDEIRKKSLKAILDLKTTINLFNTEVSEEEKVKLFEKFIQINNNLEEYGIVAPWTALNSDIYSQLENLNLIKELNYSTDEKGDLVYTMSDFSEEKLNSKIGETTRRDQIKGMIEQYFKQFPYNPFKSEDISSAFNAQVDRHNEEVFLKINNLKLKENLSEEEKEELKKLEDSLITFKIDNFNNTQVIRDLQSKKENDIRVNLENKNISVEEFEKYKTLKRDSKLYVNTFEELLGSFKVSSWADLDRSLLNDFITQITESGLLTMALENFSNISENAEKEILLNFNSLQDETLSEENFKTIKENLEPFMEFMKSFIDENYKILQNEDLIELEKEEVKITKKIQEEIESIKPSILKVSNYALDLLIDALEKGNADKEVFLEAEKLMNAEVTKVISDIFPNAKNIQYTQLQEIITNIPKFLESLESEAEMAEAGMEDSLSDFSTLKDLFNEEESSFNTDSNFEGIIPNNEFFKFLKNTYDEGLSLATIKKGLEDALKAYNKNQESLKKIDRFLKLQTSGLTLKSNPLYDFIRKFELSLDSNAESKVNKVFDLLEREELNLKSASNITNYLSDNIREQDLNQAINHLKMIKSIIYAMSTTEVSIGDPIGFIQSRKNYAEKYNQEDEVKELETITSDVATLMSQDVDALISKLKFLKDLAGFNAGKMINEQELIRSKVENILLKNWEQWTKQANPSFFPLEQINEILANKETVSKKLLKIENAIFLHNQNNKEKALQEFLKYIPNINSDNFSQIDKEVTNLESWDMAIYIATTLAMKSEDFQIRSFLTTSGDFNKAPFYTQELAAKVIKASTVNPELFAGIFRNSPNNLKTNSDFITVVLGGSGTGKTSAVFGIALDNFRQTNKETNIWVSAPTNLQKENLEKAIISSVGNNKLTLSTSNKNELFEKLGILQLIETINFQIENINSSKESKKDTPVYVELKDGLIVFTEEFLKEDWLGGIQEKLKNLPNLLLIDEITHFSSFELHILNAISRKSYYDDSLNFMKIVAAGDPTQLGKLAKIDNNYYNYNVESTNAIFTPRLWATVRAMNSQKRINNERFIRIVRELSATYKKNNENYENAKKESLTYLQENKDVNVLSYYQNNTTLHGDRIVKSLDKELVSILAKAKSENPNIVIGILTQDGNLPEEWNTLLSNAGIITPDNMSNIKLFNPTNIQGSEVDYFIFNADLISKYDKVRDNLKAFYTYITRSKIASIVVDDNNILETFHITNGKKDDYSSEFQILTDEVIKQAKSKRITDLVELLGENPTPSKFDNFEWKMGSTLTEAEKENTTLDSWYVTPTSEDSPISATFDENVEDSILKKDFKIMLHSFYNNPGAELKKGKIIHNDENPSFDLNFSEDISADNSEEVINSWIKLRYYLLNNKENKTLLSNQSQGVFNSYLENVFKGDLSSPENIDVEIVITVSQFNEDINIPYAKHGLNLDKTKRNGDLFINLSAKLTLGQKTHYVTLASFGTEEQIKEAAKRYKVSTEELENKFRALENELANSNKKFITLKIDNVNNINFFTNTRLEKKLVDKKGNKIKYSLDSLKKNFPGMYFSEIRFFPQDFQTFKNLIRKYTFGNERFTGVDVSKYQTEEKLKELHLKLRNKPYIVFSTIDDLEGNIIENNTQATLIPISAFPRKLSTLTKEVNNLLEERKQEVQKAFRENRDEKGITSSLNAKTEALLNRSDILDTLIIWANTNSDIPGKSLLDLLFEEIEFSVSNSIMGSKTSVFEIFTRFKNNPNASSLEMMKQAIEIIKDTLAKSDSKLDAKNKKIIIDKLSGIKGWHWLFFNIFGYEKIIEEASDSEFLRLMIKGQVDDQILEAFNNSEGSVKMKNILKQLVDAVKNKDFYYSIPIKPATEAGGAILANPLVSGKDGFKTEYFADKFYIGVAPEGPRILMNLETFLKAETISSITPDIVSKDKKEQEVPKELEKSENQDQGINKVEINPTISNDLDIILIKSLKDETLQQEFTPILTKIAAILGNGFTDKLNPLILEKAEVFNLANDFDKIKLILSSLGFKLMKNGTSLDILSITPVLGIENTEAIAFKKQVNNLLKTCK